MSTILPPACPKPMKNILMDPKHQPADSFGIIRNVLFIKLLSEVQKLSYTKPPPTAFICGVYVCGAFFIPLFKPILQNPTMKV
ncbi:MAG TPA: hypothetical protein PKJ03_00215, partial [Methanoregulaceae archaeon]|nr:hypothetical protein [Methanoregulaceae archaeon]